MQADIPRPRWSFAILALLTLLFGAVVASNVSAPRDPRVAIRLVAPSEHDLALLDDVWSEHAGDGVDGVIAASNLGRLVTPYRVIVDDIDAAAATERSRLRHRAAVGFFDEYRDIDELDTFMNGFETETIGTSIEGRPIRAIRISDGPIEVAIDGGHHAREWLSVMVPACIADRLAHGDDRIRRILEQVTFLVVPVVNPDGYAYSWETDRYWRKNRRRGHGVDLNRNYSVAWGEAGSSDDPRAATYRGEAPFSEPETRAMRELFARHTVAAHVDFHSYSQVLVYPWSHKRTPPADRDAFAAIADRMATALYASHGLRYDVRPGSELTVGAGGTAGDWSYGERGALSFLIELRPSSARDGGFVVPPDQIAPACDESLAAVLELAEWMIAHR